MKKYLLVVMAGLLLPLPGCAREQKTEIFSCVVVASEKDVPADNRIKNQIAKKIGARADISYKANEEYIEAMLLKGEYPDFIDAGELTGLLVKEHVLLPLDDYLDDYPNLKGLLSDWQWKRMRQEDGHIYFIPQFSVVNEKDMVVKPSEEAFYIQKRVLEWAGYPNVRTLDQYFDLIDAYIQENPISENNERNIGFEILCDDWRYFCLENVPQFLAGYPNNGCAIVDPNTHEVSVYDTIPEARQYYLRLSGEYDRGIIDRECFTQSYEQYLEKIASGNVLGMVDQHWQFEQAEAVLLEQGRIDRTYVPLGITADESVEGAYFSKAGLNTAKGLGITTGCRDIRRAMQFLDDLLKPDIMILRNWGEEGIDYEVNEEGLFYRTKDQRENQADSEWQEKNMCRYSYFPHYNGMLKDGINTVVPEEQPKEYYATLCREDRDMLDAYGFERWTDFLGEQKEVDPWYPLYVVTDKWTNDTDYGRAKEAMTEVKKEWLPQVIMASKSQFDDVWEEYMEEYDSRVDVNAYESKLEEEIARVMTEIKE